MTVYVDQFPDTGWGKWNGGGHLLTTDLDELHAMADRIGLRRAWFRDGRFPHYDVQRRKRALAIAAGAVPIGFGEIPDDVLMKAYDGTYEKRSDRLARKRPPGA